MNNLLLPWVRTTVHTTDITVILLIIPFQFIRGYYSLVITLNYPSYISFSNYLTKYLRYPERRKNKDRGDCEAGMCLKCSRNLQGRVVWLILSKSALETHSQKVTMEGVTNHTGPKGLFKENPRGF